MVPVSRGCRYFWMLLDLCVADWICSSGHIGAAGDLVTPDCRLRQQTTELLSSGAHRPPKPDAAMYLARFQIDEDSEVFA